MSWLPNWLTGYDEAPAQRAAVADAELRRMNQVKVDAGYYTPEQARQIEADYASQFSFDPAQQQASIDDAFDEGWEEGRQNVSTFIKNALNKIVADPFKAIVAGLPWWLWALALAALAFYLWPILRPLARRVTR